MEKGRRGKIAILKNNVEKKGGGRQVVYLCILYVWYSNVVNVLCG